MLDKLLMLLVGFAFLLYGIEGPLISLLGTETVGQVTSVEAQPSNHATSVRDWTVTYRFQTNNGKTITGTEHRSQVYNTSTLPPVGSTAHVKYLKALPFINEPSRNARLSPAHVLVMALGLVLVAVGLLGARRPRRTKTT